MLPTGRDLEFGDPSSGGPVPGTRRGDVLTVGAVYRNCASPVERGRVTYFSDLAIELQGLGRAFRFEGVVDDGGLGRPR